MRILLTGGAGFLGSHLCDRLLDEGHELIVMDNLLTGRAKNIAHLFGRDGFTFIKHDVTKYIYVKGPLDYVLHFASPASPDDFSRYPIRILKVGAHGTHNALGVARAKKAKFFWPQHPRFTVIRWCIHSQNRIWAMSIHWACAASMTKPSALPRP